MSNASAGPAVGTVAPPFPGTMLQLQNRSLFVRSSSPVPAAADGAAKDAALFLHGLGGSSLNWTDLMIELQGEVEGYALDLPGFGQSPPPPDGDYTTRAHARAAADVIGQLGIGPVHVFGNSMGGSVAVHLAAYYPAAVASLTLISPALPQYTAMRTNIHLPVLSVPGVGERLVSRYLRADAGWRAQATIDACFADPSRMPVQRMAEAVDEVRRRDAFPYAADAFLKSLRGLLATYRDASQGRPWKLAEQVACPVLVIHGRADRLVDARGADRASRHFSDVRVVVMPDTGHVAMMERPDATAEHWRSFRAASDGDAGASDPEPAL